MVNGTWARMSPDKRAAKLATMATTAVARTPKGIPRQPTWEITFAVYDVLKGNRVHPNPHVYGHVGSIGLLWGWDGGTDDTSGFGARNRDGAIRKLVAARTAR